jgi:metal-dependent amidase/aminoacylase/carboxypeptidase family protein
MVDYCRGVAEKYLGAGSWIEAAAPTMGAEDFAFYLKEIPGAFLWLGLGEESPALHTPAFDFNDKVIEQGILMLTGLIFDFLG